MVLGHNIWSGGALVVVVTVVGWITLVKSLLFLFLPPELMELAIADGAAIILQLDFPDLNERLRVRVLRDVCHDLLRVHSEA
jgi:hypothetical protein